MEPSKIVAPIKYDSIEEFRKEHGLEQKQMADIFGIRRQDIWHYENTLANRYSVEYLPSSKEVRILKSKPEKVFKTGTLK